MTPDLFNKYEIRISVGTAKTLLELVRGLDFSFMTVGDVIELNKLQYQLEEITERQKDV